MNGRSQEEVDSIAEDLTAAAMWGDVQLLEGYLMNNVDPNLLNAQGNTALHVASYYGERECANTLLTFKGGSGEGESEPALLPKRAGENVLVLKVACVVSGRLFTCLSEREERR